MKYNFDEIIDRRGTYAEKLESVPENTPEDALYLWVADMDFPCAEPILKALHQRIDRKIFGYTSYGNPAIREAVCHWFQKRFQWEIDASWIFCSPGVVPALGMLVQAMTEEGDGIIIQRPVYPPFTSKIEANRRKAVNSPLIRQGNTYVMDFADLEEKFADPNNKGMILCSPHNPVGRVWTEEELRHVVELATKYDKWIIADEIHCDLTRKNVTHHPLLKVAPDAKDRIISCTAPSKTFNLAGMQMSNIIIPNPEYRERWQDVVCVRNGLGDTTTMGAEAMVAAYYEGDEWLDQLREYLDGNIAYVEEYLREHLPKVQAMKCEGTYLMWLDLGAYTADHLELEQAMIKAGLIVNQGYIFGEEGRCFERLNVAAPRSVLEECMGRLEKCLSQF